MSRSQNVNLNRMLDRIGAINVPTEGWHVADGLFPSIVVAHVDRLVGTPRPPQGQFGWLQPGGGGGSWAGIALTNPDRDIVIHGISGRHYSSSVYEIYGAVATRAIADTANILSIPPAERLYPLQVGGAPPTTATYRTYSLTNPPGWGSEEECNWSTLGLGNSDSWRLEGLEWLIPANYVFFMYAKENKNFYGAVHWHEQPTGAHTGSMIAFP